MVLVYEQGYREKIKKSSELAKEYSDTSKMAETKEDGILLAKIVSDYVVLGDKVIAAKKANAPNLTQLTTQGRNLVKDIDDQFRKLDVRQQKYISERADAVLQDATATGRNALIYSIVIACIVVCMGIW